MSENHLIVDEGRTGNPHHYGYGPDHNICWDCGAEYVTTRQDYNCPGFVQDKATRQRIEKGARARGYEQGVDACALKLHNEYDRLKESDPKWARLLWDLARQMPWKKHL